MSLLVLCVSDQSQKARAVKKLKLYHGEKFKKSHLKETASVVLTVLFVAAEEFTVPLEVGPGIEVVSPGDQSFAYVLLAVYHNAFHGTELQLHHVTVLPSDIRERLVRYLVTSDQMQVTDNRKLERSRRFQQLRLSLLLLLQLQLSFLFLLLDQHDNQQEQNEKGDQEQERG